MKYLLIAVGALVLAAGAEASPLCTDMTGQSIAGLECTVGGLTFGNFQVLAAAGNASPEIELTGAAVGSDGSVTLTFDPHMTAVVGGGAQDIYLYYQVTGGATNVALNLNGTNATIQETVCSTPVSISGILPNLCEDNNPLASMIAFSNLGSNSANSGAFDAAANLYIFKDIGVLPNYPTAGGGSISSFSQTFSVPGGGGGAGTPVPEPVTMMLVGSGLVAVGFLRRRTRSK